jgi:aspartate aminotransferase
MLADRTKRIGVSPTMKVAAEALRLKAQGVDVIDLGAGEPDFPTPAHVVAGGARGDRRQLHQVHDQLRHRRAEARGLRALPRRLRGRVRAGEVIATAGGKQALYNAALCLFGPATR